MEYVLLKDLDNLVFHWIEINDELVQMWIHQMIERRSIFKCNFVDIVCPNFKTSCSCQLLLAEQSKKKTLKGDLLRAVSQLQVEGNGIKQFNFAPPSPPPSSPPPPPPPSYPLPAITASTCNPPQSATKPRKLAIKCCTKCTPTKTRPCIRANFCKTHGY